MQQNSMMPAKASWLRSFVYAIGAISCLGITAKEASALPAFARQMQTECATCHVQHFAKLNAFGREFKASGYSMTNVKSIEGDSLSIAPNLNATFFLRSQLMQSQGTRGQWLLPSEGAILMGGRLNENIGGMIEWGGPLLGAKISGSTPIGGVRIGGTAFTTDALGPAFGMELMNTGVVRNQRPFERSSRPLLDNNANLVLGHAATGMTVFAAAPTWFFNATAYMPDSAAAGATAMDADIDLAKYVRAAWIPKFGDWELGVGGGALFGKARATDANTNALQNYATNAIFADVQLQGKLMGRELGVYFLYASGDKPSTDPSTTNVFAGVENRSSGMGFDVEYFVLPKLAVLGSVGRHDNGTAGLSATTSMGLGLYWKLYQNVTLQPMLEKLSGGQRATSQIVSLTLETAW